MITIKNKLEPYRKPVTGTVVFRYTITGSKEEMAEYKKIAGEFYREDENTKEVLFFSNIPIALGTALTKNREGTKYFVKTDLEVEAVKAAELEAAELAKLNALQKFSGMSAAEIVKLVMAA